MELHERNGHVAVLDWWKTNLDHNSWQYALSNAMDDASENGHVETNTQKEEWNYTAAAMDNASRDENIVILDWWKANTKKEEWKYTADALDWASRNGHITVLDWWKANLARSEWRCTERAIKWASRDGNMAVWKWWKAN